MSEMSFTDDVLERVVDVVGRVANAVLVPWGGAVACVDAYETAIRALTDVQLSLARAVNVEPARSTLAHCAEATRDIGATHLSRMRWILDV